MSEQNYYGANQTECVAKKAYELWEKEGYKSNQDLHYWLTAEKTVKSQTPAYIPAAPKRGKPAPEFTASRR